MKQTSQSTKKKQVSPIPEGYHTVTPFLVVKQADELMDFIKNAFNGVVTSCTVDGKGRVMHATVTIGDSIVMVTDAMERLSSMPCMLYLYVDDVDAVYKQALRAKGISLREPTDEFYGDRSAGVKDRWDNQWWIATHIEDVDEKEMEKRKKEFEAPQEVF